MRNGTYYWTDQGYGPDLARYSYYIVEQTGCPNLAAFLTAQSREETNYGILFTSINNFANMGAIDSNPQAAPYFATPEDGGQGWLDFLGWDNPNSSTYRNFIAAAKAGESAVVTLAELIREGGWATDLNYAQDVAGKQ